jgi:hypothetical protein
LFLSDYYFFWFGKQAVFACMQHLNKKQPECLKNSSQNADSRCAEIAFLLMYISDNKLIKAEPACGVLVQHTPMFTGWLTCTQQSRRFGIAPAFTLSLCDSEYARKPPVPIALVVTKHAKKKEKDNGYGHKLEKLKVILYANNSNGPNT